MRVYMYFYTYPEKYLALDYKISTGRRLPYKVPVPTVRYLLSTSPSRCLGTYFNLIPRKDF